MSAGIYKNWAFAHKNRRTFAQSWENTWDLSLQILLATLRMYHSIARLFCCKPDSMLMTCWDASLTGFRREKRRWRTCYTYYTRSMINSLKAGENSTNLAHERRFWAKARVELLNTATRPDWSVETINVHICHVKRSCDRKKYAQKLAQYIQKLTGTTKANLTKIC